MIALLLLFILLFFIVRKLPYVVAFLLLLLRQLWVMLTSYWHYKYVAVPVSCFIGLFVWLVLKESPTTQWPMIITSLLLPTQLLVVATCYYFWYQTHTPNKQP